MEHRDHYLHEARRFLRVLAPALDQEVRFALGCDPDGDFTGDIRLGERFVGNFSLLPGTDIPHFAFAGEFAHLNANVAWRRQDVLKLDALRALMHREDLKQLPVVGEIWLHYRGRYYQVTSLGRHSGTGEHLIGYEDLLLGETHYRPLFDTPISSDEAWTKLREDGSPRFTLTTRETAEAWRRRELIALDEKVVALGGARA